MPPSPEHGAVLHVCRTCGGGAGGPALAAALQAALAGPDEPGVAIAAQACMGACERRCRACLAGPGRWAWLLGDLDPAQDLSDLVLFIRRWLASPDGTLTRDRRPPGVRRHLIGRVPPLP